LTFCYRWLTRSFLQSILLPYTRLQIELQNRFNNYTQREKKNCTCGCNFGLNTSSIFSLASYVFICVLFFFLRFYRIDFTFISISVIELILKWREEKKYRVDLKMLQLQGLTTYFINDILYFCSWPCLEWNKLVLFTDTLCWVNTTKEKPQAY
jgi:hypothetical protein